MLWIALVVIFTLLFGAAAVTVPSLSLDDGRTKIGKAAIPVIFALYIIGFGVTTAMFSVDSVENGHVALFKFGGAIVGQQGDGHGGLIVHAPWQTIQQANVQVQSMCADGGKPTSDGVCKGQYSAASKENVEVLVNAKLNFHVNPETIQQLYRTVGPDYVNKIVEPRVAQVLKEATVNYKLEDIIPNREEIRQAVTKRLVTELGDRSIIADDYLLTNISFNPEVQKSIDQKVIQAQAAAASEAQVKVKEAEAKQVQAVAEGAAAAKRIAADADAYANNTVNASLNGNILQLRLAEKLGDKVQFIPSGQGVIIDPATLLAPPKK